MSISRKELVSYCDQLLSINQIPDYAPNGLQVQGKDDIDCIVTGVTASLPLIEKAIELKADAIIVHHGYFWKNTSPCLIGMMHKRVQSLITHDLNLLAYHLPLDAHAELGNNAQLAKRLGLLVGERLQAEPGAPAILFRGECASRQSVVDFTQTISQSLKREPLHIAGESDTIQQVAWCTGGAQSLFDAAIALGVDAYLTGEISEKTVHSARESGVHFFACGHHATERYGVRALGEHLATEFSLAHHFVDIDNPV